MALPTHENHRDAPRQQPTPGVGMQGKAPVAAPVEAAKPVLFDDIDPVLLVRLYPEATNATEMRAAAMAAGNATYEAGQELVADQQTPVLVEGAPPPAAKPAPAHQPHRD